MNKPKAWMNKYGAIVTDYGKHNHNDTDDFNIPLYTKYELPDQEIKELCIDTCDGTFLIREDFEVIKEFVDKITDSILPDVS